MASVIPFEYDLKAVPSVDADGALWISGYASDYSRDRQDESMEPGCFDRGLKAFLKDNPIMLYHHQFDKALGTWTEAHVDDRGLFVKGKIDRPAPGSWAEDVFNKVRNGTIKSLSVGGIFRRRGNRIYDVDLAEISVTPVGINKAASFKVVAQAALAAPDGKAVNAYGSIIDAPVDHEISRLRAQVARMETEVLEMRWNRIKERM